MMTSPKKVLLVGPVLSNSGYGEHARCVLRSLISNMEKFDIYILPKNWGNTSTDSEETPENKFILSTIRRTAQYKGEYDISLQVSLPNEWQKLAKINIGLTAAVETDRCNPQWIQACNEMDKVIVVSEHAGKSFTNFKYPLQDKQGNNVGMLQLQKPYSVIGYPVKEHEDNNFSKNLNLPKNCFLSVLQGTPRKNLHALVKSFVEEFKDNEDVGLVLKMNLVKDSINDRQALIKNLNMMMETIEESDQRKCKIFLLHGRLKEEELHSLYCDERIKAYVTTTHGEGYGLPVFEAAYSGLPVIAPNWSGYLDFLRAPVKNEKSGKTKRRSLFLKTKFELKDVHESCLMENIIIPNSQWAYVDESSLRKNMRKVLDSHSLYVKESKILKNYLEEEYSEEKIHQKFMNEIEKFYPELFVDDSLEDDDFALFMKENNE